MHVCGDCDSGGIGRKLIAGNIVVVVVIKSTGCNAPLGHPLSLAAEALRWWRGGPAEEWSQAEFDSWSLNRLQNYHQLVGGNGFCDMTSSASNLITKSK